jgi:hypothetical protein
MAWRTHDCATSFPDAAIALIFPLLSASVRTVVRKRTLLVF